MNPQRRYIIITPLKNEVKFLPEVLKHVINQTILPSLWIFIDDGSTDGSYELLTEWAKKISWIKTLRLKGKEKREIGFHYAEVVASGFDYIKKVWDDLYDYIGILDADIVLPQDYYEKLIKKFEEDKALGVASGIVICKTNRITYQEKEPPEWPSGAARLWRRECFEKTGWQINRGPDSVSTVKAMSCGYKTRNYDDLQVIHLRPTWSSCGYWRGYTDIGKTRYYLGYDPFFIACASLKYIYDYPHIGTIPFLIGYFGDFFTYRKRIDDRAVIDFFKNRLMYKLKSRLKKLFKKNEM